MNSICRYGVPLQKQPKAAPPQDQPQNNAHVARSLLRLYGFALEGAKPDQHDELLEHFRMLGKALGVM